MATQQKKVYVLEIQADNARQQLADTIKQLDTLDAQLTGIDRDSEAGKKLVAEMAAAAKAVQSLAQEVEGLEDDLDSFSPGSIGALEREVEELERAWKRTTAGTKESEAALLALGRAKGEVRALEDAVDALHPKERAAAFVDFTNGIVGGFSIATAAASSWGTLSAESAQKAEAAMQQLLVVMSGFEAISKATNSETLANVKNMLALGKAYLFGAESASTASKITRAALLATGLGAIIVLVGLLVANWENLKAKFAGSEKLFAKIHEVASGVFSGLLASLKNVGEVVEKLWDGDFSGAVAKAKHIGQDIAKGYAQGVQEVIDDANRQLLAKQIEAQERALKVQQAGGFDTAKLQRQILANKLAVLKQGTEEEKKAYANAAAELQAFDAAQRKKNREETLDATLARINGVVALEQARGQDSYQSQLRQKRNELTGLLAAETKNGAAIIAKRTEIAAFIAQHETEQAAKRRALFVQKQQEELALVGQQGKDTLDLRLSFAEQLLANDTDVLRKREQQHRQASEQELEQARASSQALQLVQAEYDEKTRAGLAENQAQRQDVLQQGRETDAKFIAGTADFLADVANKSLQRKDFDLGGTILTKIFGVKEEDVAKVKGVLNQAFAEVAQSVGSVVSTMLAAGMQEAEAQIQAAQDRLQQLDSQLSEAISRRQSDEEALQSATGAKRQYLIDKVNQERKAEEQLAAQRAKSAREEASAQKEKAALEKQQQQIAAASTAIEATLLAIQAAQTVVKIASKGFAGYDNIALAIAGAATIAASMFAVKNAAKQFEAGTGALGEDGVLRGPRHSGGGVGLYSRNGHYFGEAEGGEAITPVDATQRNGPALEKIRTKGRTRTLTPADFADLPHASAVAPRSATHYAAGSGGIGLVGPAAWRAQAEEAFASVQLVPTPKSYYEPGGLLNRAGAPAGGYASAGDMSALASRLDRQTAILSGILDKAGDTVSNTARAADHAATTAQATTTTAKFGPLVLEFGYDAELKRQQLQADAAQAQQHATL